jgi:hypothetical protein
MTNIVQPDSDCHAEEIPPPSCDQAKECIRVYPQMNNHFFKCQLEISPWLRIVSAMRIPAGVVLLALLPVSLGLRAQSAADAAAEFKTAAATLSAARLNGETESEAQQEKALVYLDAVAASVLNGSPTPDLETVNQRLDALVSHTPSVGENYRLIKLGGSPAAYAMAVNFGLGGPAAVRIYAAASGHYTLAARIDHFTQKEFYDSDIELVPVWPSEQVFVTVGGRTDDLSTGMFSAWRFDGHRAVPLWSSDLLQQSNYQADANGFHITYCGRPDENRPSECLKMTRDLYRYQNGEWKRMESTDLPPAKPPAK